MYGCLFDLLFCSRCSIPTNTLKFEEGGSNLERGRKTEILAAGVHVFTVAHPGLYAALGDNGSLGVLSYPSIT